MKKISLTVLAVSFLNVALFAQTIFDEIATSEELNTISTSVPFLLIAPDSRAGAMGDIGVATSPDHNSIHWNASKLAFIEDDRGVSLSYTPWLQDLVPEISLSYLSGFKKIKFKEYNCR